MILMIHPPMNVKRWRETGRDTHAVAYIAPGLGGFDETFEWLDRAADYLTGSASLTHLWSRASSGSAMRAAPKAPRSSEQ